MQEIIHKIESKGFKYNPALSSNRELRFGSKGSLSVDLQKQAFYDHESGEGGSLKQFNISIDNRNYRPSTEPNEKVERNFKIARKIWKETKPIEGTIAEKYLRETRYLGDCFIPPDIRFHPSLYHKIGRKYPAMVAVVKDIKSKEIRGIHRTWFNPETFDKASIEPNKMMLSNICGAGVIIGAFFNPLIICEGIETALTLHLESGYPVIAALSASNMKKLILPPITKVSELIIAADNDENLAGFKAAEALAERATMNGYQVKIITPPKGYSDFNDILLEKRK